jgi:hypothetical protein
MTTLGIAAKLMLDRVRENRTPVSVTRPEADVGTLPRRMSTRSYVAAICAWLAASAVAVVWLSRIAGDD